MTAPQPAARQSILIVEDEPIVRLATADFLRECGFDVHEAESAEDALQILEEHGRHISLVFTDVALAGSLNGLDIAKWVQKRLPGVTVLLASGDHAKASAAETLCGRGSFFKKPYDLKRVLTRIREGLKPSIE